MPFGEVAGEILGGAIRLIGRVFVEIVFEVCVKGLGYLVCRLFTRTVNSEGILVVVVGLLAWTFLLAGLYFSYEYISVQIEIDRCLDSGGSYNHKSSQCDLPSA